MPTLAYEIVQNNPASGPDRINFKGFAVGNPYTDAFTNNLGQFEKFYGEQIIPKPLWTKYLNDCSTPDSYSRHQHDCEHAEDNFNDMIGNLDPYALDFPVCTSSQGMRLMKASGSPLKYDPCVDNYVATYMNLAEVKKAIHADASITWAECSDSTDYDGDDMNIPMMPLYKKLVGTNGIKIMVFSGDDDTVCSTASTQNWIWDLGYKVNDLWQVWNLDDQVAGYYTTFEKDFAFVTVHSAGHEVPSFQPARALALLKNYLNGHWFNPKLAKTQGLSSVSLAQE